MRQILTTLVDRTTSARAAATLSIFFGLVCLFGWATRNKSLTGVLMGSVDMKTNTALGVMACGFALLVLADGTAGRLARVAQSSSAAAMLIGLTTLAEYCFGWELGIDELLFADPSGAYDVFHGRMSPYSAAALGALGAALLALPHKSLYGVARWGAACGIAVGLISLLGYLWNATEIVTDTWLPPVALNTAVCFTLLGTGILLSAPARGATDGPPANAFAGVEIRILAGFIASMSLLLLGGSYTYRANVRLADSVEWIVHSQEIRASLASLTGALAGAEVALRDYMLTTDARQLAEYRRLADDAQRDLGDLKRLDTGDTVHQQSLAELALIVNSRLSAMADTLAAFTASGLSAARALIEQDRKTNSPRDIRQLASHIAAVEKRALAVRQRAIMGMRDITLISLLGTLAIAAGFFTALFRGIRREILARRDVENALRASEQYNRSIVDSSPDCLAVLTLDARLIQMTPQGCRLMDVDDFSAIADRDWLSLWAAEDRVAAGAAFDSARSGRDGRFQGYCPTLKGTPKWWDVIVMPVLGADGKSERLLAVARDISDVKRSERKLLEANRFLDSLIENLPVMVVIKDAATLQFVRLNRSFERFLGYSREEFIGKDARDFFAPEEADFIMAKDREALDLGRLVDIPEQRIDTGRLGVRIFHTMKMPLGDKGGKPEFLLAIAVDITDRKLAEQAIHELNAALEIKAEQLTATNSELESFSYSVSHDLRAPLRAIDGFAQMIEEDYLDRLDAEGRRYLSVIRENSKRMAALIDDLLAFSRLGRQPVMTEELDVASLVREVVDDALQDRDQPLARIEIGSLPPARGDRGLLRQVWTNLLSNAMKYSSKSVRPRIEITGRPDGSENVYSIRDNGVGFDMEYAHKLFGVFQRLHRADEFSGTGVGLAIVHRIVTRHGGRVWAEGKVNDGAVFSFALPKGGIDA